MLFKHTSPVARSARFAPADQDEDLPGLDEQAADPDPKPSMEQLEISRLSDELDDLQRRFDDLSSGWESGVAAACAQARSEAAAQHIRDDSKTLGALTETLTDARSAFEHNFCDREERLAVELATVALGRMVRAAEDDRAWLVRSISHRVSGLRADAIVALHLSPQDFADPLLAQVREGLPAGTEIVADPGQPAGTARIALRLGSVMVDPAKGLAALIEEIDDARD